VICSLHLCRKYPRAFFNSCSIPELVAEIAEIFEARSKWIHQNLSREHKENLDWRIWCISGNYFFSLLFLILSKFISLSQFHDWSWCVLNELCCRLVWPHFMFNVSVLVFRELSADNRVPQSRCHSSTSGYVRDQTFNWYINSACY
jgi:hypothetical protein